MTARDIIYQINTRRTCVNSFIWNQNRFESSSNFAMDASRDSYLYKNQFTSIKLIYDSKERNSCLARPPRTFISESRQFSCLLCCVASYNLVKYFLLAFLLFYQ
jgi:hypothetical protein